MKIAMRWLHPLTKSVKPNNLKIALYIWVFNLITGIIVIYTLWNLFSFTAGKSILLQDIESHNLLTLLIDVFITNRPSFYLALSFMVLLALFFMIISVFVSGGIFSVLINNEIKTFKNLISSSIENFFRFLILFVINLAGWLVLIILSAGVFYSLKAFLLHTGDETLFKLFLYLWIFIIYLLAIVAIAIYDFSRIIQIKTDRNFFHCYQKAYGFVLTRKRIIFPVFILYSMVIVIFHLILSALTVQIENSIPVFLSLLVSQIFIILKYFIKVILMNTEVNLMTTEPKS